MTNEEFRKYYNEQKLQGRSESQIARSLGISLKHLIGRVNGMGIQSRQKVDTPKPEKKSEVKPASEVPKTEEKVEEPKEEKPVEEFNWMD